MNSNFIIIIGLAAVLAVLVIGVASMLRGGEFNRKYANRLMQLRVLLQFGVILIIVVLLLLGQG